MNTVEIHDRIQDLKVKIRSIEKILYDRRVADRMCIERRQDEVLSNIFNNTVRHNTKQGYRPEVTEEFIEEIRTGKYGRTEQ